jgi:hypothetical protein
MTPRAGVKTTLATERAFQGSAIPSGGPYFFMGEPAVPRLSSSSLPRHLSAAANTEERSPIPPRFVDLSFWQTRDSAQNVARCAGVPVGNPLRHFE